MTSTSRRRPESTPTESADPLADLRYVDDAGPGYRRRRRGRGFTYLDVDGSPLGDAEIARLRGLAVPPAWTDVWLCPDPLGHVQATGRDAKGRKQYRYHPAWNAARSEAKFESLVEFGHALPKLRSQVDEDMRRRELCFERVVATTVWLLDRTLIRIGNREYAGESYGLTTLLDDHVDVGASRLRFRFIGKSGKPHDLVVTDRRVARIVRQCQELPGQQLLQYVDGDAVRAVGSRDVNDYVRDITQTPFSAKTFRTWGASAAALEFLRRCGPPESTSDAAAQARAAIADVAARLRNTPAVCRSSYVHPLIIEAHADGTLHQLTRRRRRCDAGLEDEEVDLLRLLGR